METNNMETLLDQAEKEMFSQADAHFEKALRVMAEEKEAVEIERQREEGADEEYEPYLD